MSSKSKNRRRKGGGKKRSGSRKGRYSKNQKRSRRTAGGRRNTVAIGNTKVSNRNQRTRVKGPFFKFPFTLIFIVLLVALSGSAMADVDLTISSDQADEVITVTEYEDWENGTYTQKAINSTWYHANFTLDEKGLYRINNTDISTVMNIQDDTELNFSKMVIAWVYVTDSYGYPAGNVTVDAESEKLLFTGRTDKNGTLLMYVENRTVYEFSVDGDSKLVYIEGLTNVDLEYDKEEAAADPGLFYTEYNGMPAWMLFIIAIAGIGVFAWLSTIKMPVLFLVLLVVLIFGPMLVAVGLVPGVIIFIILALVVATLLVLIIWKLFNRV